MKDLQIYNLFHKSLNKRNTIKRDLYFYEKLFEVYINTPTAFFEVGILNYPLFYNTTQHTWHDMSQRLQVPKGIYRKGLAVYYLINPRKADLHQRVVYAPRETQKNDKKVLNAIGLRQDSKCYAKAHEIK